MEKLVYLDNSRKNEILHTAIQRSFPCVLTVRRDQTWQTFKTRLVAGSEQAGRVDVAMPPNNDAGAPVEFLIGERIGLTFRRGHKKVLISTSVRGVGQSAAGPIDDAEVPCVALAWPEALQEMQRRVYHRATPVGRRVIVRFWRGGIARRAEAENGGVLTGTMLDVSAGGLRLLTIEASPDDFEVGESLGCAFTPKPRGHTFVLDTLFRHCALDNDGASTVGLQFVGLETTVRGRNTLADLARLVTEYQRAVTRNTPRPVNRPRR